MNKKQEEHFGLRPSAIDKVVYIGNLEGEKIFCKIDYIDGKLSITGVINPKENGDASSCGQIVDTLDENQKVIEFSEWWNRPRLVQFVEIGHEWHLNDLKAGNPTQEAFVKEWEGRGNKYEYGAVCKAMEEAGILTDNGYRYGSAWLKVEVPTVVLKWLAGLPESTIVPNLI